MKLKHLLVYILILNVNYLMAQGIPSPTEIRNDGRPLTVGIVFQSDSAAVVTGLKVYRAWEGQITGQLWTQTGRLLATTSFPEGQTGWQTGFFLNPIPIFQDSAYVATYWSASGSYGAQERYFPASFPSWEALDSRYAYFNDPVYPENSYNRTNDGIEPIIGIVPSTPDPDPAPGQTVVIYRDTCSLNYDSLQSIKFVLMLPEEGGTFMLPDSTTVYRATFGAAPPHITRKDDATLIVERFIRGTGTARRRITLYTTGAYLREKFINNRWQPE